MNPYYMASGNPAQGDSGGSAAIRQEFAAIQAAFSKLPPLVGGAGKVLAVSADETSLVLTTPSGPGFTPSGVLGIRTRVGAVVSVRTSGAI